MKDKIAQRERTDALVGGYTARTFNEFVKEKAGEHKITPACVRSVPEVKAEWKQIQAKRKEAKTADKLAKSAETKAQKKALSDAKKAEKKAEKDAKKAEKKTTEELVKDKTAIKKVAKKSAVDAENIKMTLIEKAHKKSQAEKPPQEPKVKGRPKKYATPEEARRAKIEATKVLNRAKKAQQPPKEKKAPAPPKVTKNTLDPDVVDAELKIYLAKTDKELDDVLKSIKKASVRYDNLNERSRQSYDHTLQIYSQKRMKLLEARRKEEDEKEAELERRKMDKSTREQAIKEGKAERLKNLAMFKNAKENIRKQRMAELEQREVATKPPPRKQVIKKIDRSKVRKMVEDVGRLEEGEVYEGRGMNPDDLKEFANYGKIQEHLGQHLNDLKEAIDPKDLRDYIHFTKEKARLKEKLFGGRMIGGWNFSGRDWSPKTFAYNALLNGLTENYRSNVTSKGVAEDVKRNIDDAVALAKNPNIEANTIGRVQGQLSRYDGGAYSSSDSESDSDSDQDLEMIGGESLGFFGNIKRAFNTSLNNQGTPIERKATSVLLNDIEPALLTPLNILAPPVGKIGEAQRKLLKSHYNL